MGVVWPCVTVWVWSGPCVSVGVDWALRHSVGGLDPAQQCVGVVWALRHCGCGLGPALQCVGVVHGCPLKVTQTKCIANSPPVVL